MNGRMELKRKYGLVHVPNRHRLERWLRRYEELRDEGEPPETAGLRAAREVFPYETQERNSPELPTAEAVATALAEGFTS
ncbi:MAG: hypothetical protein ACOC47_03945 [Alkalispirochaetaceae bacterium]